MRKENLVIHLIFAKNMMKYIMFVKFLEVNHKINQSWFLPDVTVCGHMGIKIRWVSKSFIANCALVGSSGAMSGLMFLQMSLLSESLLAYFALKWSLT